MIYVCDAIMGTGKSQSAITYMNEHSDQKFIYITPFLDEAKRIKDGCKNLRFVEPTNKLYQYGNSKIRHTAALIDEGRNITSTHQAFKCYTPEMLQSIKDNEYTLIIDENVSVLEKADYHMQDIEILVQTGYLQRDGDKYRRTKQQYKGTCFDDLFRLVQNRDLIGLSEVPDEQDDTGGVLFYWNLSPELISAFKDVFILTYLFKGQSLYNLLMMYNMQYQQVGVEKTDVGTGFRFCKHASYIPDYVYKLRDMIHILDDSRMNAVGDESTALSMSWYDKSNYNCEEIKAKINSWFRYINKDVPQGKRMWATYEKDKSAVSGKGYTKSFVSFNSKATNIYKDRTCLAYAVNLYMNVCDKCFYQKHGVDVNDDDYALSIMVQWIWRSAIRDGKEVYLYIPSSRMRGLLIDWINKVSEEVNQKDVQERM